MCLVAHPLSQPNSDVSPIWTPIMEADTRKLKLRLVQIIRKSSILYWYYKGTSFKQWFYFLLRPIWYSEMFFCLNSSLR
jgi:hypothetical protein